MGRKRGFWAEVQRGMAQSARDQQRAQAAAVREQARLEREMERAQRAEAQMRARMVREDRAAAKAEQKELERLHFEARNAEVEALNAELAAKLGEIDGVLEATLAVDDHVDLETLRKAAEHPPFSSSYSVPIAMPVPVRAPPEPEFIPPPAPTGIASIFSRRKHEASLKEARAAFEARHQAWRTEASQVPGRQYAQMEEHARAEAERKRMLQVDLDAYNHESATRDANAQRDNTRLDQLIAGLERGQKEAVEEYIGIVFGNSLYPDDCVAVADYGYDAQSRELRVDLQLPRPDELPTQRSFKYSKSTDEITSIEQPVKDQRERYSRLVYNSTLRTLHEVWESDRLGHIATISLTGAVEHVDRAIGRDVRTPIIAVAVARETFDAIDLSRVDALETLRHLRATVSKDPYALVAIGVGPNVRAH